MPAKKTASSRGRRRTVAKSPAASLAALPGAAGWLSLAQQVRGWADSIVRMAGPATDMAVAAAGARTEDPGKRAAIHKAGAVLRRMRESAGMTVQDLARALDLRDPDLLASAESGAAALPAELVLRLAAVLGRDDPMTATMRLTRAYSPELWKTLEQIGIGKLVVQAGREREMANLYRANDQARRLSDEEFARVLAFTQQAFEMAVAFASKPKSSK